MDWNVIVTVRPGPGHEREVLGALAHLGCFRSTAFRDVCAGRVEEVGAFLEAVDRARADERRWAGHIARVVPIERVVQFEPETLADQLKEAIGPLVASLTDGSSFCVRLERRGLAGKVPSPDIERAAAEHVYALAAADNKRLQTDFGDPDFIIAAETLGTECGIMLLPRVLRERYPFVQVR